jgi:V/A-type H+-transporting ATPase subunit C
MSILDYSYTNARIRSLKGKLFSAEFLKTLVSCDTLEEIINILSDTMYGGDINQAVYFTSGARGIELGLRNHFIRSLEFLKERVLSEKALKLSLPLLERWDVHNLKVIIRALHAGRPKKEMEESFVPAGRLSLSVLNELSSFLDLKEIISMLQTLGCPLYVPLKDNLTQYLAERNIQEYEIALDKYYFEMAKKEISTKYFKFLDYLDQNKKITLTMIAIEIDIVNLITALKLTSSWVDPEKGIEHFYIRGGARLSFKDFESILNAETLEEKIELLKETPYGERIRKSLRDVEISGFVSPLQRRLEELLIREAVSLFKAYPLSIAPVIAFIWAKYNEVVNLRIIIRGKEAQIPNERIMGSLIFVET